MTWKDDAKIKEQTFNGYIETKAYGRLTDPTNKTLMELHPSPLVSSTILWPLHTFSIFYEVSRLF